MTDDQPQLTIFISSMIGSLWDQRAAIEEAITTGIPLARTWVFERAPASSEPIAESYLARQIEQLDTQVVWVDGGGDWGGGGAFETRMTRRGRRARKGCLVFRGFRAFRGFRVKKGR